LHPECCLGHHFGLKSQLGSCLQGGGGQQVLHSEQQQADSKLLNKTVRVIFVRIAFSCFICIVIILIFRSFFAKFIHKGCKKETFLHQFAQTTTSLVVLLGSMKEEGSLVGSLVGMKAVGSTLEVGKQVCMVVGSKLVLAVGSKQAVGSILVLDSILVYMAVDSKDRDRSSSLST
jgi:hypothetical protein